MGDAETKELSVPADSNDLTAGSIPGKLIRFFFPVLAGMLFQQLYSTVDAAIVGKVLGAGALAAVGGGTSVIIETVIGFFVGLISGAAVVISQCFGAGDVEKLHRVLHTFIMFCLIIGAVITSLLMFFAPYFLKCINTPDDIFQDSVIYLRTYFIGTIPLLLHNLFQGTMQAVGNSGRPLRYLVISSTMNIVLDILFVAILGYGVAGAAWATVISMAVCALLSLRYLTQVIGPHRVVLKSVRLDFETLKMPLKIGIPSGLETSMYCIANLIILAGVNGFGTKVAAAWTATGKLDGFYWATITAFSTTFCAFAGQCFGAGNIARLKKGMRCWMAICMGATAVLSCLLLLISRSAYGMILSDGDVVESASSIMRCFVPFYFIWSYIDLLAGTFRGTGDTFYPMVITLVGTCLFRIFWMFVIVPIDHTIYTVGYVFPVSWFLTGVAFTVYYYRNSKLRKSYRKEKNPL